MTSWLKVILLSTIIGLGGIISLISVEITNSQAWASPELDAQYSLNSLGVLKIEDHVEGVFAEPVTLIYKNYFSHQSRFSIVDLSKTDSILTRSKLPLSKTLHDSQILRQVARTTHTESMIRTKVSKRGANFLFDMEWIHTPHVEGLAHQTFEVPSPPRGVPLDEVTLTPIFHENISKLLAQVPFQGQITGTDGKTVVVNLGMQSGIQKGDIFHVGTLQQVKHHPLLKKVVEWDFVPVGTLKVEQVEEGISFCKIVDGKKIARYQKITSIERASVSPSAAQSLETGSRLLASNTMSDSDEEESSPGSKQPLLGYVALSLPVGSYSRQFTPNGTNTLSGSGLLFGGKTDAEIWLTKNWFSNLELGYGFWNFSQSSVSTGTPTQTGSVAGSVFSFKFDVGYAYLLKNDVLGPKVWAKLGYKSNSYSLPLSVSESTGPISFRSVFIGIGGYVPIYQTWGAILDFNYRILTSAGQSWLSEDTTGTTDIELFIGGFYQLAPNMKIRGGFQIQATGADFSAGSSLSQKTITFVPSLLYYF